MQNTTPQSWRLPHVIRSTYQHFKITNYFLKNYRYIFISTNKRFLSIRSCSSVGTQKLIFSLFQCRFYCNHRACSVNTVAAFWWDCTNITSCYITTNRCSFVWILHNSNIRLSARCYLVCHWFDTVDLMFCIVELMMYFCGVQAHRSLKMALSWASS